MAKMPKEVVEFFQQDPVKVPKVIATVDAKGVPNVVPKGSLVAVDEETIAYADLAPGKTRSNLKPGARVAIAAFKLPPAGYQVKGTFQGFQTSGPLVERFAKMLKPMGMDVRSVGVIKVEEVYSLSPADAGKRIV